MPSEYIFDSDLDKGIPKVRYMNARAKKLLMVEEGSK